MVNKNNWEETKENFKNFWEKTDQKRSLLSLNVSQDFYQQKSCKVEPEDYEKLYLSPEFMYKRFKDEMNSKIYVAETIPCFWLNFGTAAHAAYFGALPQYSLDTVWFKPNLLEPDINKLQYDQKEYLFKKHKSVAAAMSQFSNNEFVVGMPDNCGILDALAHIRGSENLLMDLIEAPDFVHEACDKITKVWKKTQGEFFDILSENNEGGSSHGWMKLWCPKRHAQIQCDFSVMISSEMFEEFVLPEIEECSNFLDYTTYHLDGQEQIRHLDMILSCKNLTNIQWTRVKGQPKTSVFLKELQKIQKAGKGLILFPDIDEVPLLLQNLSHKGLYLYIDEPLSIEEANSLIHLAEKEAH